MSESARLDVIDFLFIGLTRTSETHVQLETKQVVFVSIAKLFGVSQVDVCKYVKCHNKRLIWQLLLYLIVYICMSYYVFRSCNFFRPHLPSKNSYA